MIMSNLINANIYTERKRIKGRIINIKKLKESIIDYNFWLQKNHREDRIENYEEFLQVH